MKHLICQTEAKYSQLSAQVDQIIRRAMTRLYWNNIYLISAEADVENIADLQWIANYMLQDCNRVVVLAAQCEDLNLIVAKSANVTHLYIDELMDSIVSTFGGHYTGNTSFAQATFYQFHLMPDIIDYAVESIVVAMPYN